MVEVLPNSLGRFPKEDRGIGLAGTWYILYCASCGEEGGRVLENYLPEQFAFYLCTPCAEKYGEVAGCTATPDDVFFKKVQEAMIEQYGHILNESEILQQLEDSSSVVSKLEREAQRR